MKCRVRVWDNGDAINCGQNEPCEEHPLTIIYVFITGHTFVPGDKGAAIFTACALTNRGKWLAGAVSRSERVALERCRVMAERKAPSMLSGKFEVTVSDIREYHVLQALDLALENMP